MDPKTVQFEGLKTGFRQNKDGYVLSLAIHPDDVPSELMKDFVGSRYMVVMVRLAEAVPVTGGLILDLLSVDGAVVRPSRRSGGKYHPRKPAQAAAKRRLVRKRR